jgi:hypothetical protein
VAKLDPKQQLAVRTILGALETAVGKQHPEMAGMPAVVQVASLEHCDTSEHAPYCSQLMEAIDAARALDAAH